MNHKKSKANAQKQIDCQDCPCGGGAYLVCCAPLINDGLSANTPEQLMRSRYTAYVLGDMAYLRKTWHVDFCPVELTHDTAVHWLGLKVKSFAHQGVSGRVEFVARYKIAGRAYKMHEVSEFVLERGQWFYTTGVLLGE